MQNIVGQVASKENFFHRPKEIAEIKRLLEAGGNMQLAAPRRVGKSSILHYFLDHPMQGWLFIYIDVESARTKQEFYRKVYTHILRSTLLTEKKNLVKQLIDKASAPLRRIKSLKIAGVAEIALNDEVSVDYEEELLNLLEGVDIGSDRLIIMVDEFPEVLLNMQEDANGDTKSVRSFLQSNREFRTRASFRGKIQFIYTGSNSLNSTVKEFSSTELISDLPPVMVAPLTLAEGRIFLSQIFKHYKIKIDSTVIDHALTSIEWLIPFYLQLLVKEILAVSDEGAVIQIQDIDNAIDQISQPRNDNYFQHYVSRLKRVYGPEKTKLVKELLKRISDEKQLTKAQIVDMATGRFDLQQLKPVLDKLLFDGYIVKDTGDNYKFNSPILQNWWNKNEAI